MVYRTEKNPCRVKQEFTPYQDDYFFDENIGELVKLPGPVNCSERINSYTYTRLDEVFDRFLDGSYDPQVDKAVYGDGTNKGFDLSDLGDLYESIERAREEHQLSDDIPLGEVYATLRDKIISQRAKSAAVEEVKVDEEKVSDE